MGKWVEIDDIRRPAAEVAAEILRERVGQVQRTIPLAAFDAQQDIEHVHQLRVACRRAGAALQAFRLLAKRKSKPLQKCLKKIRRAAGPARDLDVLLARLQAERETQPGHEYVVERLRQQRERAQQALVLLSDGPGSENLDKALQRCVAALEKQATQRDGVRFDAFARDAVRAASKPLLQLSGLEAASVEQLHQFRIAGKRLRYSIELFHESLPKSLHDEVYPRVEKLQSRLGKLNDHATAQGFYQGWLAELPVGQRAAQLAARVVVEHAAIESIRNEFLRWWTTRRMAALESQLSSLLQERE